MNMEQEEKETKLYCPRCGSEHLVAGNKGFKAGNAAAGAVVAGGAGLLAGFIGSGKVKVTCLECGSEWLPGQLDTKKVTEEQIKDFEKWNSDLDRNGCIFGIGFAIFMLIIILIHCSA